MDPLERRVKLLEAELALVKAQMDVQQARGEAPAARHEQVKCRNCSMPIPSGDAEAHLRDDGMGFGRWDCPIARRQY